MIQKLVNTIEFTIKSYPGDWDGFSKILLFGTKMSFPEVCHYYEGFELSWNNGLLKWKVFLGIKGQASLTFYIEKDKRAIGSAVLSDLSDSQALYDFIAYVGCGEELFDKPNATVGALFLHE